MLIFIKLKDFFSYSFTEAKLVTGNVYKNSKTKRGRRVEMILLVIQKS